MALIYRWTFEKVITEIIGNYAASTTNAVFLSSSKVSGNYSLYCGGNVQSYYTGNQVGLVADSSFTISHWVKAGSQSTKNTVSFYSTSFRNWSIDSGTSSGGLNLVYNTTSTVRAVSAPVLDNKWHLYTVSYDSGAVKNYVDGVYYNGGDITPPNFSGYSNAGYSIGYFQPFPGSSYFTGYLDDLRVYDNVLTAAEVRTLYNSYFTEKVGPMFLA